MTQPSWRAHLTPEEKREVREADRELASLRGRAKALAAARKVIVNRAVKRVKYAAGRK